MDRDRIKRVMWIAVAMAVIGMLMGSCGAEEWSDEQIANAIYKAENSVKYPYGIKSIDTHGDKDYARKICLNTIKNNRKRFAKQTEHTDFIVFLGSRYCPPKGKNLTSLERKCNIHWVGNVKYFLKKGV